MFPSSSARAAKRQKIEEYRKGSVIKVEVRNFMTYAQATIEPGPHLNLVLGPNGTGKSSLVCALCVGLGGSTKLLGRAEHVSSFVRRGTRDGEVKITLSSGDPDRPHVVERHINAETNGSTWKVNKKEVNMKDVIDLVKKLNIQLDNLCQFLPQDKVVEFARMKPVELLNATEEAVGDSSLRTMHDELIQLREKLANRQSEEAEILADLERLRTENARTERTVQVIREKERLEQEAEEVRLKVPWAEYDELKKKFKEDKEQLKVAEESLRARRAQQQEDDGPLKAKAKAAERAVTAEKKARDLRDKADYNAAVGRGPNAKTRLTAVEDLVAAIESKQEELESLANKSESRRRRIEQAKAAIEKAEEDIGRAEAECQESAGVEKKRKELQMAMNDLAVQEVSITQEMETHRAEEEEHNGAMRHPREQLNRLGDSRMQRLQFLESKHRNIGKAWEWIRANKSRFQGPVYGPVAMEIECPDSVHANMLETQISNVWLSYFVVLHQADQELLLHELQQHANYRANVAVYRGDPNAPLAYDLGKSTDYVRFGMTNTLDSVFQAPMVVKHALNDNFYLSRTFVCREDGDWEGFFQAQPNARVVYTPQNRISQTVSKYNSSAVATMVTPLRPAQQLRGGAAASREAAQRAELEQRIHQAQAAMEQAARKRAALEPDLRAILDRKNAIKAEMQQINQGIGEAKRRLANAKATKTLRERELQRYENSHDPLQKKPALERELGSLRNDVVAAADDLADAYCAWAERAMNHTAPHLSARELTDQVDKMKSAARERVSQLQRMESLVAEFQRQMGLSKAAMDQKHADAKRATGWPIPDDLAAKFASMPGTASELRALATHKAEQAGEMMISDPGALQRYQACCAQIAENERQLEVASREREYHAGKIEEIKQRWVSELRRITSTINANFSAAFPSVGCAGEVVLREAENDDFAKYAIDIRVKFRENEEMSTLDANRQSGGERSVSTILYLVALQEVAAAPFRVVDEINQGMDPINERKVFRLLVDAATQPNTPQCFLLTPKLLPDLPFSRQVTVLQIMNGTQIKPVAQGFTQDRLLGNRTQLLTANA